MSNKDLQQFLKKFPDKMPVMLHVEDNVLIPFSLENIVINKEGDEIGKQGGLIRGVKGTVIVINPPIT